MYVEHNKPNWDKLQAISVLTSDSPKLGPALNVHYMGSIYIRKPTKKENVEVNVNKNTDENGIYI